MGSGLIVAMTFMAINIFGAFYFWGGTAGLEQLVLSLADSVSHFSLVSVPMFVLMGEIMFQSGIAPQMLDAIDKWLGRLPGRLSLLAVGGGTLFATLTGTSMATVALLGTTLLPEMDKRGYARSMSMGPILGSGALATMIPPSSLAIIFGAIGEISIGRLLVAVILPGLVLAAVYATYIIGRCSLQPHLAPPYAVSSTPWKEKLSVAAKYVLPVGGIVFAVIGLMLMGITTPTEASALGVLGIVVLAAALRRLTSTVAKKSILGTLKVTVMLFAILAGAKAFSQILAFSGASRGLAEFVVGLPVAPIFVVLAMMLVLLVLGMFMEVISIMMITIPLFVPVIMKMGLDPVWFGLIFLLNMEIGAMSPPFGLGLFTMKGVAPAGTTIGQIYKASVPFCLCAIAALLVIMVFPPIAQWLPNIMR